MPYQHPEYLISSAELEARLDDPKLRIYDATVSLRPSENGPYRAESGEPVSYTHLTLPTKA